jgi:hypothetical protein
MRFDLQTIKDRWVDSHALDALDSQWASRARLDVSTLIAEIEGLRRECQRLRQANREVAALWVEGQERLETLSRELAMARGALEHIVQDLDRPVRAYHRGTRGLTIRSSRS